MIDELNNVRAVLAKANVYFDGKVVSHTVMLEDGARKTVGVTFPCTLSAATDDSAEDIDCVAGSGEYRLPGSDEWIRSGTGERFHIPANTKFEFRTSEPYHYICHYR